MKALITVSYDGTNYCGWQKQGKGEATVQHEIERALCGLYGCEVHLLGASRTDSGVHAVGQRASFTIPDDRIKIDKLHLALNGNLPKDIRVLKAEEKSDGFHVINDVRHKTYCYYIENCPVFSPLMFRYAHHVKEPLSLEAMEKAASLFVGRHDFKAFCAARSEVRTTIREIYKCGITKNANTIIVTVCGNGFLYNMVRIIVGTVIEIGAGKKKSEDVPYIIGSKNRELAGKTAPAKGLVLFSVSYAEQADYL